MARREREGCNGDAVVVSGGKRCRNQQQRQQRQQPAQFSARAICAYEMTTLGVEHTSRGRGEGGRDGPRGGGGGAAATRQLKEMSFLQDLAATEAEERDRSFKASSLGHSLPAPVSKSNEQGGLGIRYMACACLVKF